MHRIASLACSLLLAAALCQAQNEPEYLLELGGGAGMATYTGDLNGNLLKGMQPMGALVAKYKPNPRMAWTAMLGLGLLKGSSKNVTTSYPDMDVSPVEFTSTVTDFTLRYECHFWAYGTGEEYRGARRIVPFFALGAGLTFAKPKGGEQAVAAQLPIGVGVKYKMSQRLNLALEWTMHFTGSDKLDGVKDPYGIESSGLFKNTDCYSVLGLTLTYDLWAKCRTCHNDHDD